MFPQTNILKSNKLHLTRQTAVLSLLCPFYTYISRWGFWGQGVDLRSPTICFLNVAVDCGDANVIHILKNVNDNNNNNNK